MPIFGLATSTRTLLVMFVTDDVQYGIVYFDEADQRYHYHCKICSTSFSGENGSRIDDKADDHEYEHQVNDEK